MKPIVAIVGRPNVGKSTLFNKMAGRKKAVVFDEPGVTRDLNYADVEARDKAYTLVDTGGFESGSTDDIFSQVMEQLRIAVEEADVIVFVLDGRAGAASGDFELAKALRRSGKPVLFAVNKCDSFEVERQTQDFYSLGADELYLVSAEHGRGVDELMEAIVKALPETPVEDEQPEGRVRVAILGRPNVGKSSLLNRLLGRKRSIVSDVAGTTRDPIDTPFEREGRSYLFVDTAGIRRKSRVDRGVEAFSVMEAIKAMDRCDIALLILDATAGLSDQDEKIASLIDARSRPAIIVVNKWDAVEKDSKTQIEITRRIKELMPFISYAPVIFVSALTGQKADKVFETIDRVADKSKVRFQTSVLNNAMESICARYRPPVYRGKEVKFYYVTQAGPVPPAFLIFTNFPDGLTESYKRYVENAMRDSLDLADIPVRLVFRKRH